MLNSCILWPGYIDKDGYGQISSNKDGTLRTARVVLEQNLGRKIRERYHAHHTCYNRLCVNPSHIVELCSNQNNKDKFYDDRPNHPIIALTKEKVFLIRHLLESGESPDKIAKYFSTPIEVIPFIRDWKVWDYLVNSLTKLDKLKYLLKLETYFPKQACIVFPILNSNGYGSVNYKDKIYPAHRFAWQLTYGEPSKGRVIAHECDNPGCIRPSHLIETDQKTNIAHKIKRGRNYESPKLKGKDELIYHLAKQGKSFREIARLLDVGCHKSISRRFKKIEKKYSLETYKPKNPK